MLPAGMCAAGALGPGKAAVQNFLGVLLLCQRQRPQVTLTKATPGGAAPLACAELVCIHGIEGFHGSIKVTPKLSKCRVLRVTIVRPCSRAVAASSPSMLPSGLPCCCAWAVSIPQRLEMDLVTGRRLLPNHPLRSASIHRSRSLRFLPGARSSMPLRISPRHKTLVKSLAGSAAATQRLTLVSGGMVLRLNSER